ncbi:MAG TPA: metal ABC transporter substrate-binding protein [Geminicoccaceae bacterium]|nr:metal ABC transporter substrate-binding protein [Geminicoccaceae bacterium]
MDRRNLLGTALASASLIALSVPLHAATPGKLKVVATITILGDMVRQVGGPDVAVTTLVGPDGDAHAYEPTPADAKALSAADLVVVNGLGLEGWMDRLVQASGYRGAIVVASQGVNPRYIDEGGRTVTDPHAWQDLKNGHRYVVNIESALAGVDPAHAADYQAAGKSYLTAIDAMDSHIRSEIAEVPPERRKVVSSHDGFGYFGQTYGVEFVAPQGISEDAEPSAADLKKLIDQIRSEHIKVLFFENALSPRLVEQIGRETGAVVGGTLYADALSPPDGPAPTYLDMFRHNLPLLKAAMLGKSA